MKGITCVVCNTSFNLRSTKARYVTCPDCLSSNLTVQAYSPHEKEREQRWKEIMKRPETKKQKARAKRLIQYARKRAENRKRSLRGEWV